MKDGYVRVGCAGFEVQLTQVKENAKKVIDYVHKASGDDIKVLVFPELCLTGYSIEDLFYQKRVINEVYTQLDYIKEETEHLDLLFVIGAPLVHHNKLYNCAVVFNQGEILGIVPKSHIPTYHEFYEGRHFASAPECLSTMTINGNDIPFGTDIIFEANNFEHLKIGIEIGEDLNVPMSPSIRHCLNGATLILNLSASNHLAGLNDYRRQLVNTQSAKLVCAYALSNAGLGESSTDVVFGGHHMISENGHLLDESMLYEEGYIYQDVDLETIVSARLEMSTYPNRTDDYYYIPFELDYTDIEELERYYTQYPFIPSSCDERMKRCQEVLDIQVHALMQRLKAIRCKTCVIGISGGLDSTLALLVTHKAYELLGYPFENIIAVTMPCFGTTDRTLNNALTLMKELGVTSLTVNIKEAVMVHFRDIDHDINNHNVTYENAQARERTQVLMDIANKENGIVVGTGDLSEVALGWATYNGDHMSMYGVNCSVPKTLVRHLVDYAASLYKGTLVESTLKDILDTPVSPELLPAKDNEIVQKTEDVIGPYELHDFFLYHHVKYHYEPKKLYRIAAIAFKDVYNEETIKKWITLFYRRFFTQQFKRSCVPDGIKVGSIALSPRGDFRMPSDTTISLWLKQCEEL